MRHFVAATRLAAVGLLLAGAACKSDPATPDGPPRGWRVQVGQQAPDFLLVTTNAEKMRLAEHRGKVVVANFFGTSCAYCRAEVEAFKTQLVPKFEGDERIAVWTIAYREPRSTVADFIRARRYEWPFLLDFDGEVFAQYAEPGLPRLVVIDHDGKIASLHTGFGPGAMEKLLAELEPLVARVPAGGKVDPFVKTPSFSSEGTLGGGVE